MNLYKDGEIKQITSPKVVQRLIRQGWSTDEIEQEPEEGDCLPETPKKRGRPAKKEELS